MRAPTIADHLWNFGFFVVMNTLILLPTWLKSRRAKGSYRWRYYAASAPVLIFVWSLSWQWLFDSTAGSMWPFGLVLAGGFSAIIWLFFAWLEWSDKSP
jgi:bacteriorhodopsin